MFTWFRACSNFRLRSNRPRFTDLVQNLQKHRYLLLIGSLLAVVLLVLCTGSAGPAKAATGTFTNPTPIVINDDDIATPYPSTITVPALIGTVSKVTVTLNGFTHTFPSDVRMLLVGPGGQSSVFFGYPTDGTAGTAVLNAVVTFDDAAATPLPCVGPFGTGTYKPNVCDNVFTGINATATNFQAPAPPLPYTTPLSVFNNVNPGGIWSLYIVDDVGGDNGTINAGWTLNITTSTLPTLTKAFTPAVILPGTTSTLSFTLTNPNPAPLTNVTFNDALPAQITMVNTTVGGSCVGTVTPPPAGASGTIAVTGVTIPASGNCTINLNVTSSTLGSWNNATGTVTTAETGPLVGPGSNTATLTVVTHVALTKSFTPSTIQPGDISTLLFTLTNPNPTPRTNVGFADTLPDQIKIASATATSSCGGTITLPPTGTTGAITVSGVNIPANSSCSITALVLSNTPGIFTNSVTTLTTAEDGSVAINAVATLIVTGYHTDPADLIPQLRVTPDRVAGKDEFNVISYTFKLKNIGLGTAGFLGIELPIDPNLVIGYTKFEHPKVYVTAVTTNTVSISLPPLNYNEVVTGTLVFRPKAGATVGAKVFTRYKVHYDDPTGVGFLRQSNAVAFVIGAAGINLNVSKGAIQLLGPDSPSLKAGNSQTFTADFFIPDEPLSAWITKPDGTSIPLGNNRADPRGNYSLQVDTTGLAPGTYSVAIFGQRSEITGSGVLIIT